MRMHAPDHVVMGNIGLDLICLFSHCLLILLLNKLRVAWWLLLFFLFFSNSCSLPLLLFFSTGCIAIYSLNEFNKLMHFIHQIVSSFSFSNFLLLLYSKFIRISGIIARFRPWTLVAKRMQNSSTMSMKS